MAFSKFHIEGTFLRSKVARRVFVLFVLSAFAPAAILTVFAYLHVRDLDAEYGQRQLALEASNYARGIYERLLGAHSSLNVQAAVLKAKIKMTGAGIANTQHVFRSVTVVHGAKLTTLAGEPHSGSMPPIDASAWAHLARGESALLPQEGMFKDRTLLVSAIDPARPERGMLVAEIERNYLWGHADEFSYQTQACVLDATPKVLFCTADKVRDIAVSAAGTGQAMTTGATADWQYVSRRLFLRARFDAQDWSVLTLRPVAGAVATMSRLTYTFLGIVLLTLLFVTFLSGLQIRRTLVPLEQLMDGTRRIAREVFDQPVPVERDDEFGHLAKALNSMAARLGRHIGTLRALSAVDQEILSRVDITQIIDRVQDRLQQLWPSAVTGVVVFDQAAADFGIVHLHSGKSGITTKVPTKIEPWLLRRLARDYDGEWFEVGASKLPDFLTMVAHAGAKRILTLPIFLREQVHGMLVIGLQAQQQLSGELISQARDLGSRVGVALAVQTREEELKYRAYHDSLTGLPNRALLVERLNQQIAYARRDRKPFALIYLDIDQFKNVNESYGRESGDRLLCQVAERLSSCTRECDTVARIGGDKFVVLLAGLDKPQLAAALAAEMMTLLRDPFVIVDNNCRISVSMGVALFPDDGTMAQALIKRADMAWYRAKALGGARIVFFDDGVNVSPIEPLTQAGKT